MTKSVSSASTRRAHIFTNMWRVSHSLCRIGVGVTTSRVSRSQLTMINHVSNTREKLLEIRCCEFFLLLRSSVRWLIMIGWDPFILYGSSSRFELLCKEYWDSFVRKIDFEFRDEATRSGNLPRLSFHALYEERQPRIILPHLSYPTLFAAVICSGPASGPLPRPRRLA